MVNEKQVFIRGRLASWSEKHSCGYISVSGELMYVSLITYDGMPSQIRAGEGVICVSAYGGIYTWYMMSDSCLELDADLQDSIPPIMKIRKLRVDEDDV